MINVFLDDTERPVVGVVIVLCNVVCQRVCNVFLLSSVWVCGDETLNNMNITNQYTRHVISVDCLFCIHSPPGKVFFTGDVSSNKQLGWSTGAIQTSCLILFETEEQPLSFVRWSSWPIYLFDWFISNGNYSIILAWQKENVVNLLCLCILSVSRLRPNKMRVLKYYVEDKALFETWK